MEPRARFSILFNLLLIGAIVAFQIFFFSGSAAPEIPYSRFLDDVDAGKVASVAITADKIYGVRVDPDAAGKQHPDHAHPEAISPPAKETPWHFDPITWLRAMREDVRTVRAQQEHERSLQFTVTPVDDPGLIDRLQRHGVEFRAQIESHFFRNLLSNWILPFGVLFLIWGFLARRMGGGPSALQIGRSKAKIYEADPKTLVHFSDVAGVDEAVEEVREVVAFLKEPERFTRLGAKLPRGVLLMGPPGTGKTLLAKAVAGESGVPFFSLSGSDFVEMFVGVGASRVRDLFASAKEKAPCIIFIDELDAIGKSRGGRSAMLGGYDESENTLNQLLVEMDGFSADAAVVIMAATNRPEILDPALLRPGRFDRQVLVGRPHRAGRRAIFDVHARRLDLDPDVDLDRMAAQTAGMVGADIANLCNEAALLASRRGSPRVCMRDFQDAFERLIGGTEKKGQVMSERDRRTVAYHESGHAIVGYLTPGADPVQKISIVPRGQGALGYTLQAPDEDRLLLSRHDLLGRVRTLLGGRAAEALVFGEISTGASDDLEKANKIVRDMLTVYGMGERRPNLSLADASSGGFLGQRGALVPHSPELDRLLDEEQQSIVDQAYAEATDVLTRHREQLEAMAKRLLEVEKIDRDDVEAILGPRPAAD